jgi:hypothetical protein
VDIDELFVVGERLAEKAFHRYPEGASGPGALRRSPRSSIHGEAQEEQLTMPRHSLVDLKIQVVKVEIDVDHALRDR